MRTLFAPVLFCLACLLSMSAFAVTSIDNVRVYRAPEYTRFVFDVSEPAKYQVLPDVAPGRVVIDFREAALKANLDAVDLKDSPVRRVRSGQQSDGTTRVVLDLAVAIRVNSFALPPNELYGHRLVVDLYDLVPQAAPADDTATAAPLSVVPAVPVITSPGTTTPGIATPAMATPATAPTAPAIVPPAAVPPPAAAASAPAAVVAKPAPSTAPPAVAATPVPAPSPVTPTPPPSVASAVPPRPPAPPGVAPAAGTSPAAAPPRPAPAAASSVTPVNAMPPMQLVEPRRVIVAIDAGHGGDDPGARGPQGTHEKDVVLAIARAVRDRMRDEPGMRAVLIRDGDYYVGLKERRTKARKKYDADLFVSIHADAFTRREARGASVFAVSRRGATSTLAAYLANSENRADLVGGIDPRTDNDLISVISDMMMEGTMRESLQLGRGVLDELGDFARLHKRSVEQAGFMVLKEPNMPSILVETGFISNPEEERLLRTAAYQQRLAGAIVNGVRRYFEKSPPPGTWFAARRDGHMAAPVATSVSATTAGSAAEEFNDEPDGDALMTLAQAGSDRKQAANDNAGRKVGKQADAKTRVAANYVKHKVGKGQSLGWLAKKYGVSKSEIKSANNLKRDDIRIGETLKIPAK